MQDPRSRITLEEIHQIVQEQTAKLLIIQTGKIALQTVGIIGSILAEQAMQQVVKKSVTIAAQKTSEQLAKQVAKTTAQEAARLAAKQAAQKAAQEAAKNAAKLAAQKLALQTAKKTAQELAKKAAEFTAQKIAEQTAKKAAIELAATTAKVMTGQGSMLIQVVKSAAKLSGQKMALEATKKAAQEAAKMATQEAAKLASQVAMRQAAKKTAEQAAKQAAKLAAEESAKLAASKSAQIAIQQAGKVAIQQAIQNGSQLVAKGFFSQALQYAPFLGLAINGTMGIVDLCNGNIKYGLLNIGQGLVSTIPGVGTGLSLAMSVGIGYMKIQDSLNRQQENLNNGHDPNIPRQLNVNVHMNEQQVGYITWAQLQNGEIIAYESQRNISISTRILHRIRFNVTQNEHATKICRADLLYLEQRLQNILNDHIISGNFQNRVNHSRELPNPCVRSTNLQKTNQLPHHDQVRVCRQCFPVAITPITNSVYFERVENQGNRKVLRVLRNEVFNEQNVNFDYFRLKKGMIFEEHLPQQGEPGYNVYFNQAGRLANRIYFRVSWSGRLMRW